MTRTRPTLKQRRMFALIRALGGMVAALYLSVVVVVNMINGATLQGSLLYTALVAVAAYAYAAWNLRHLAASAREEQTGR